MVVQACNNECLALELTTHLAILVTYIKSFIFETTDIGGLFDASACLNSVYILVLV